MESKPQTGELRITQVKAAPGERRHLTVLFADMEGFTGVSERLGEEKTYALMQSVYELMAEAVRAEGGTVREFTGDGIMALFGVPIAMEDATLRACRAGLAIQAKLADAAADLERRHGVRPRMRIGINTGPAVVGQIEEGATATALGDTVNLASRLQALADPGSVMLSDAAHRMVQGLVESTPAGEHKIKGKREPQKTFRVDRLRPGAVRFDATLSRGLTEYVGRTEELELLRQSFRDSRDSLRVIDIVGEPGIGKSRLVYEFREQLVRDETFVLSGSCSPDGRQTPFLPFIDIVRGSFGVAFGAPEHEVARRLADGLTVLDLNSPENLGLLLNLLGLHVPPDALQGLDGTLVGLRTRDLLHNLLRQRCRLGPVVMIVEDLHWIDSVSEEVLAKIANSTDLRCLLLVCTRRPEYRADWLQQDTLSLGPLSENQISDIVRERLGVNLLNAEFSSLVAAKAEGNALFAEEIASFLLERGAVRRLEKRLEFDAGELASVLPESIQSLLTARIDRLPAEDRNLLQAASVIGRRFNPSLLAAITAENGDVSARLDVLEQVDLVFRDGKSGDCVFKHALIQDALYDSLLSSSRQVIHLSVGEEIERRSVGRRTEFAEMLAFHFSRTDQVGKAFVYLVAAGQKSLGVYSLEEAERYFAQARKLLEAAPDCAADQEVAPFLAEYVRLLALTTKIQQATDLFERHRQRIERVADQRVYVAALNFACLAMYEQAQFRACEVQALKAFEIAQALNDDYSIAYAFSAFAAIRAIRGSGTPEDTEAIGLKAVEASHRTDDAYVQVWSLYVMAWSSMYRGLLKEGRHYIERLLEVGELQKDPRALGFAQWLLGFMAIIEERYEDAIVFGRKARAISVTAYDTSAGLMVEGIGLTLSGRVNEGFASLQAYRDKEAALSHHYGLMGANPIYGVALVLRGTFKAGIRCLEDAIARAEEAGSPVTADWARLTLGDVYVELLTSKERPPLGILLKNIGFLSMLRVRAPRQALALYQRVLQNEQFGKTGMVAARAHAGIGIIYKLQRRLDLARQHLTLARALCEGSAGAPISLRIRKALDDLDHA